MRASNARAYALGVVRPNGFHIRTIRWGWVGAKAEKRKGELIVRCVLMLDERDIFWGYYTKQRK